MPHHSASPDEELAALEAEIAELKRQITALPTAPLDPTEAEALIGRLDELIARHAALQLRRRNQPRKGGEGSPEEKPSGGRASS
ncbi:MAG TPA: hypothetical protein VF234_05085 [Limnochordia bacterium]